MANLFFYRRNYKRKEKVENPAEGEPTEKEVTETYWDCFNVDKVVRGHWTNVDEFTVYLDDGHEQADDVQKPKLNAKGQVVGIELKRERAWYMSQVPLNKEDAERFALIFDKRIESGEQKVVAREEAQGGYNCKPRDNY
jgi:hypothetical protein